MQLTVITVCFNAEKPLKEHLSQLFYKMIKILNI